MSLNYCMLKDFSSYQLNKDMNEVRQAFRDGLAKYTAANGISQASMQGEILKAGQNARMSPVRDNAADATQNTVSKTDGNNPSARLGQATGPGPPENLRSPPHP